ncbi:MAG: hypothetical protein ACP5R5_11515, partial [Armatimonadota bacterium]
MAASTRRRLWAVVKKALKQPFAAGVLVLGAIFSLGYLSVIPAALAAVAAVAYAAWKLRDTDFIRAAIREAGQREREAELVARTFRIEALDVDSR